MSALRRARFLARLVLAGYLLVAGLAVAASVVQPQGVQWLCTGGAGMKLVLPEGGDAQPTGADCLLCLHAADSAPGPGAQGRDAPRLVSATPALPTVLPSRRSDATRPPARGPPHLA